jgi:hypothetical protein
MLLLVETGSMWQMMCFSGLILDLLTERRGDEGSTMSFAPRRQEGRREPGLD